MSILFQLLFILVSILLIPDIFNFSLNNSDVLRTHNFNNYFTAIKEAIKENVDITNNGDLVAAAVTGWVLVVLFLIGLGILVVWIKWGGTGGKMNDHIYTLLLYECTQKQKQLKGIYLNAKVSQLLYIHFFFSMVHMGIFL